MITEVLGLLAHAMIATGYAGLVVIKVAEWWGRPPLA
jgi:hypothetical protein